MTVSTVKGAPGGSTLALLLARAIAAASTAEPRCVLAECDPSGGDLAPRLGLPGLPGVASLALAARHGLTLEILLSHTQAAACAPGVRLLPGIAGPEQGMALSWILGDLGRALEETSAMAVTDLGRLRVDRDTNDELRKRAWANVLVTNDDVASLLHARAAVESARAFGSTFHIVLAGERTRSAAHVSRATDAQVVGAMRFDARAVALVLRPQAGPAGYATRTPRRSRGLASDADEILSSLQASSESLRQPESLGPADSFRPHDVAAGAHDDTRPLRRGVRGRLRRRPVLVG